MGMGDLIDDIQDALGATQGLVINDSMGFDVVEASVDEPLENEADVVYEYHIHLRGLPTADFPVEVRLPAGEIYFTENGRTGNRTEPLVFTTNNWDEDQIISISVYNDVGANDDMYDIRHHYGSGNVAHRILRLNVRDRDDPGTKEIILSSASEEEVDQNDIFTYNVKLGGVPDDGADVTVNIIVSPNSRGRITLSTYELTFNGDNWDNNQEVTITTGAYSSTGLNRFDIIHRAFGAIAGYSGVEKRFIVAITESESDTIITFDELTSPEAIEIATYNPTIPVQTGGRYIYVASAYPFAGIDFELLNPEDTFEGTAYQYLDASGSWNNVLEIRSDFGFDEIEGTVLWDMPTLGSSNTAWSKYDYDEEGIYYWVRMVRNDNTNKISALRTASVASFKYFERGTEPWDWVEYNDKRTERPKELGEKAADTWIDSDDEIIEQYAPLHLQWRGILDNTTIPITSYDIGDNDLEVVTRVIVHGRNGVKGFAVDFDREDELNIIKEKIITNAWELSTPAECNQHAELVLSQYKPKDLGGFQHGTITIHAYPAYKVSDRRPIAVREGDMVRVSIRDGTFMGDSELNNEPFLVLGIDFQENESNFVLIVSRVLLPTPDTLSSNSTLTNLLKKERSHAWNSMVPSESSATDNILHKNRGIYEPTFRMRLDDDGRVVYDTFTGNDKNPSLSDNWDSHIIQDRNAWVIGGAVCFDELGSDGETHLTRALGAYDDYGNPVPTTNPRAAGVFTYDNETETLRARIGKGDPNATLRDVAIGEWQRISEIPDSGEVPITFPAKYKNPPLVIATVDGSNMNTESLVSAYLMRVTGNTTDGYTGGMIKIMAQSTSGSGSHSHSITGQTLDAEQHSLSDSFITGTTTIDTLIQGRIQTSASSLVLDDETDEATYTVHLSESPGENNTIVVTIDAFDSDAISVSPTSLTFTNDTFNMGQTITVNRSTNSDSSIDFTSIRHRITGGDYVASDVLLNVFIVEESEIIPITPVSGGIDLSRTSISLTELGSSETYTINLTESPNEGDVVRVYIENPSTDSVGVNRSILEFNDVNYSSPQPVTLEAVGDGNTSDETVRLRHTIIAGDYNASDVTLVVTVTDAGVVITPSEDVDGSIRLSRTPGSTITINEGSTFTYTVRLSDEPNENDTVTVSIESTDTSVVSVDNSSFDFTSANYNVGRTVTVTGESDTDIDTETASIIHSISDGEYDAGAEYITVRVNDTTDTAIDGSIITSRSGTILIDEADTFIYTVRLGEQPLAGDTIDVDISSNDISIATVSVSSLSFNSSTWNMNQQVTVTGEQVDATDTATITHSLSHSNYTANPVSFDVRVNDTGTGNVQGTVSFSTRNLTVDEGDTNTYTVTLTPAPIDIVVMDINRISGSSEIFVSSPSAMQLTFIPSVRMRTVTMRANADTDTIEETATFEHVISSGSYDITNTTTDTVTVTVEETTVTDVSGAISFSPSSLSVDEDGSRTYRISLSQAPNDTVTIRAETNSLDIDIGSVDSASDTAEFTPTSFTNKQITVFGREDNDNDDSTVTINHTIQSGAYTLTNSGDYTVNVNDTIIASVSGNIVLSESGTLTVDERDFRDYTVHLDEEPPNVVVVALSSDNENLTLNRSTLTFTSSNHDDPQTVRATAEDFAGTGNINGVEVRHRIQSGAYDASDEYLYFNLIQQDTERIITREQDSSSSPEDTFMTMNEGGQRFYYVELASRPGNTVVINLEVDSGDVDSNDPEISINKSSLTFTTSNWNRRQQVRVTSRTNSISFDTDFDIIHYVDSDSVYAASDVRLTIRVNNDAAGVIQLSPGRRGV